MGQFWPAPPPRTAALTLIRGIALAGTLPPSVSVADGVVTLVGMVENGNGLTLSGSFQTVASLPAWAVPSANVLAPGTTAAVTGGAIVQVTSAGSLNLGSSSTRVAFAFSYPLL